MADVPVGVFLSGGIDSSLIAAIAARFNPRPLETFSISFPGSEHDEGPYARAVAQGLGTIHREFPFEPGDMRRVLNEAAMLFDQPLADTAVLPLMALSRAAAEHVKVVLTGDGGDELFAGYRKYQRMVSAPGNSRWLSRVSAGLFPVQELAACQSDSLGLRKMRARLAMVIAPSCRSEYHRQGWEGWERFSLYRPELNNSIDGHFESIRDSSHGTWMTIWTPLNEALRMDQRDSAGRSAATERRQRDDGIRTGSPRAAAGSPPGSDRRPASHFAQSDARENESRTARSRQPVLVGRDYRPTQKGLFDAARPMVPK